MTATVDTEPAANTLTYNAAQSQELLDSSKPGTATGGTMVYSLDGKEFTPNLPKAKDAGTYTVYYKAQGDQNHTDSAVDTVDVTIAQQTVTPKIELSPPSGQYDGKVQQPAVTVRDTANNVIPNSEYTVVYDSATNWKDVGKHKVKVQNVTGGNYIITEAEAEFEISTSAQAPLEIVNKPGLVYYGDTFTLSATGGSSSQAVTWSSSDENIAHVDANGFVTIKGVGQATITATKAGDGNYDTATATYPLNALKKPVTAIVTADDKVYNGDTTATIHVTWSGLVGTDIIGTTDLVGTFEDANVGANKKVTITGDPTSDATSQKYDITVQRTTTASILKATVAAPNVTAVSDLEYTGNAQALVTGGDANTLYSGSQNGVYSATVPQKTNAGTYTVWYKAQGDDNHSDSAPQAIEVTISPKTLTDANVTVELSGNDLKTETKAGVTVHYYEYDGTEKTPSVVIKDGAAVIPAREYTVTYSDNKNVGTSATVTITDKEGGNYKITINGTVSFEIRAGAAELVSSPTAKSLTYTGAAQELVNVGTATGGQIKYRLHSDTDPQPDYGTDIPEGTNAGTYTVDYKVVGDDNHEDGPTGSVTVTIQPKTVVSPKITVTGTYTYDGTEQKPIGAAVTVVDGTTTIDASEYTLSYRDNVNAGTATVIVTDNNGGNYTVSGTATFEIGKVAATVGTVPTGKADLKYNGTAQELLATLGTATGGTMVYSLTQNGEYSAAIPTRKAVGSYTIWYKVQGDANHEDTEAQSVSGSIAVNNVSNPTIQVTPESVTYNGKKQEPTVTVKDDAGLLIDGSEYTVTYVDKADANNSGLILAGTYTVTVSAKADGNYTFTKTAEYTILPADQTPLTITGTRERVCYGDTIPLATNGGVSGGTVTWKVNDGAPATIDKDTGVLTVTGVGNVTVTATSTKTGYADQTATWPFYADKKAITAIVTAKDKPYDGTTDATLTVTWKDSDVGTDTIETANKLTGEFTDANAGTDKTVKITGTITHEKYDITVPATATASITKADIDTADTTKVTAPEAATGLIYTGLPLTLVTAGTVTEGGTMEYSTDNVTWSTVLPTGTDAGKYDVWYRVKGDGNHNDTAAVKLTTDTSKVTITPQTVGAPIIELTPNEVSYDGVAHKPSVTVKDANGREIPASEYEVSYGASDWKSVSSDTVKHIVTVTDKAGGNYDITTKTEEFKILPAGQDPLSIVNQPGTVRYGTDFTLSVTGGSGAGTVSWSSDKTGIASIDQNGKVTVHQAGGPVTITATRTAAGHTVATATWTFSAEKKPVTAIITASDKVYSGDAAATLTIDWNPGDVLTADVTALTNNLANALTGTFGSAGVGDNKTVTIALKTGIELPDGGNKYAVSFNRTTTASITPATITVTPPEPVALLEYTGQPLNLVTAGSAPNGTITYSLDGTVFSRNLPRGKDAGSYTVWYQVNGSENYKDVAPAVVTVTISPKTVSSPSIELSPETFEYDGTPKKPDVVVKDGNTVIPAGEYTVSYSNNTAVGTATVTITDNDGGNYIVSGEARFTIKAAAVKLTTPPEPLDQTYTGKPLRLVSAGVAENGTVMYSLDGGEYGTAIPRATDAGNYEIGYKVVDADGKTVIPENFVYVTIAPKEVIPTIKLAGSSSYSVAYDGQAKEPAVTVYVGTKQCAEGTYTVEYANNTNAGTAEVTVQSVEDSNYEFLAFKTFTITKAKESFNPAPAAKQNLSYNGMAQPLVTQGTGKYGGIVVYSLDNGPYSTAIPTAINRGDYTVYAKVQGSGNYDESDVVTIPVTIGVNTVSAVDLTVTLPDSNFPYTGGEIRPTVTVRDRDGNVIDGGEYTVTYSNNIAVGTATIDIKSKLSGNYSFTKTVTFTITDGSQAPLIITGKRDTVTYGDSFTLGVTGGGSGAVTWSSSYTDVATITSGGTLSIKKAGSVTITATRDGKSAEWQFYAYPRQITALVTVADKEFDGTNHIDPNRLTVTLSGVLPGDIVNLTATGQFIDENAGANKTVLITGLSDLEAIKDQYEVSYNQTATASITPKPAGVTGGSVTGKNLTYNGTAQALVDAGVTVEGGNLAYSLDGNTYTLTIPTATEVGSYPVWYKVVAGDENHKDSAPVRVSPDPAITANLDKPSAVQCNPSSFTYDGTEKTPEVVVLDSTGTHIIPASEYTVSFSPSPVRDEGKYSVTVTDKPGGSYSFTSPIEFKDIFEIVASSQAPVSITDKPGTVRYGDTFYLSATGGTGGGKIVWDIESTGTAPATITQDGAVTVNDVGTFTVKAYRAASDGYSVSNTDTVTFTAQPKVVTPVVTAEDKTYNGKTDATLTATVKSTDLVNSGDKVDLTVIGAFASPDAGTGKRVDLGTCTVAGAAKDKYTIDWPASVTATINRANATITAQPGALNPVANGTDQNLVSPGTADMGAIVYSLDQNGVYSNTIPQASAPGNYRVWYKIADSANYTVQAPAYVDVTIAAAPGGGTNDADSTYSTPSETSDQSGTVTTTETDATDNKTETVENPDGSSVTTVEQADGTAATVNTSAEGKVEAEVTLSEETVAAAQAGSKAITLPIPAVEAAASSEDAPVVTVNTGSTEPVKVLIPTTEAKPGTVAMIVNADGTEEVVRSSVSTGDGLAVTLADGATVKLVDNSKTFSDVTDEDWEADAVAFASAHELFTGTGESTFSPDDPMTNAMMMTVLARLDGVDTSGGSTWYEKSVEWAVANGISDGSNPDGNISREQLAVMLWRYAGSPDPTGGLESFQDANLVSDYAQQAMRWAVEKGIVSGFGDGTLSPQGETTRAQVAQLLKNYMEKT